MCKRLFCIIVILSAVLAANFASALAQSESASVPISVSLIEEPATEEPTSTSNANDGAADPLLNSTAPVVTALPETGAAPLSLASIWVIAAMLGMGLMVMVGGLISGRHSKYPRVE